MLETKSTSTKSTLRKSALRALAPALLLTVAASPVLASACSDQIATIERRLNSAGAVAATGSTPSDGKVASNPSQGLQTPPAGKPSDPATAPDGSSVEKARGLIAQARKQEAAGDQKGCEDTMTEAKKAAGALP